MVLRDARASKNNCSTFPTSNQVGKTPEEKIEPDKLDGDVDTSEAIWFVNSKSFIDNYWSIEEIQFYWELMSSFCELKVVRTWLKSCWHILLFILLNQAIYESLQIKSVTWAHNDEMSLQPNHFITSLLGGV